MKKVVISILGQDRPGIIAKVSKAFLDCGCNIENVSQTILQSEFSGIFIVSVPPSHNLDDLDKYLQEKLNPSGLHAYVKYLEPPDTNLTAKKSEPFVITTKGPDQKGLVAAVTEIMAKHNVNVTNLKAVFKGGDDPNRNIMIYEVDIPEGADQKILDTELREKTGDLGLQISIQHRRIFEAINRI